MPTSPTLRSTVFAHLQVVAVPVHVRLSDVWQQELFVSTTSNSHMESRSLLGSRLLETSTTSHPRPSTLLHLTTLSSSNCCRVSPVKRLTRPQSGVRTRKSPPRWSS